MVCAQRQTARGRLKRLLDLRGGVATESPLETRVRHALREANYPAPSLQYDIFDHGQYVIRADFAWPQQRVVLHCDSFTWHSRRRQFELDAAQRSGLAAIDWVSSIVTSRMLESKAWLADFKRTLDRRAPLLTS